jgi:ABC-2 type transport system ATP-binding protein
MSAASYIGRIGGLAVALGVGAAIFSGQGVANATPASDDSSQNGGDNQGGGGTTATNDTVKPRPRKIDLKLPTLADVGGRHLTGPISASQTTAAIPNQIAETKKRVADAIQNAADHTVVRSTRPRTDGSSLTDRPAARTNRADAPTSLPDNSGNGAAPTTNVVANEFVNTATAVKDWVASSQAVAGRSAVTTQTVSTPLWTPPRIVTPPGTVSAPSTITRATTPLAVALNIANPLAGGAPGTPAGVDSPFALILAGAARREIGIESLTSQAVLAPTATSLIYDPTISLVNGVISGDNTANHEDGVIYLVASQPSGGGKVFIDPQGNFTYLPDFSSVQDRSQTETFGVVVAQPTPFVATLLGLPLFGALYQPTFAILYSTPGVGAAMAPLIGPSQVTEETIAVQQYAPGEQPVAFTVMIASPVDGALISTNYFPAYSVAADPTGNTTAPTVLNGPGLASAGNIDPNAPSTVDGLVPGINFLREAGYNVVTWDPRGEFDSGGVLQLDSPEYEGRDVVGIIDWVVDNADFTHPAFDNDSETDNNPSAVPGDDTDPAIGMVGGSYGGGIQFATAINDQRIDVIVPGIAWNSLEDALYPREAFKTSYASLLLLSLVASGARINPQLYTGIITGDALGVLTPSQIALLRRSGPFDFIDQIDTPTMFIQGTVDVLFPLDQALANAATIGTPAEDIRMIWYCGGHGVCLTEDADQLADQEVRLRENTIDFLGNYLLGQDNEIPKFQFVDQNGQWYTADLIPTDTGFYTGGTPVVASQADGGQLFFTVYTRGSGPQPLAGSPQSLGLAAPAPEENSINVPIHADVPVGESTTVVGAPTLSFDYSGVGLTRHVFAQIVDKKTGLVVGNIVTPVPVTLDGTDQHVDIAMENIVWTYTNTGDPATSNVDDLELQITGTATPYASNFAYGVIDISNVTISLPTPGVAANVEPEVTAALLAV